MRDRTRAFFRYFRAFKTDYTTLEYLKTEILNIYSLTGQILKQLSPEVEVISGGYLPSRGYIR